MMPVVYGSALSEPVPFWKAKSLTELSTQEWESLCDGCGKCCLIKLEDEDSGDIAYTRLHCKLLDAKTCRCKDYENRKAIVHDCVKLTPAKISELKWMPKSCAYRVLHEGGALPGWHHLICGDKMRVHDEGHSIMGLTLSEETVLEDHQIDWIVDWEGNEP